MSDIPGIDLTDLEDQRPKTLVVPPTVPGRVVHIDADFLAYQVSADEAKTLADMEHNCDVIIETMRLRAGAEKFMLHLTPRGSTKGNRYDIALIKDYQANRRDKPKPKLLHVIREWMHKERGAALYPNCEADDGMAMAQAKAIREGCHNQSIIVSRDKDLAMVPGLALNWETGEITDTKDNPFGWINLVQDTDKNGKKKAAKIRGRGTHLFWIQMLQGDTADNISGLPKICVDGKQKACGPVAAYNLLKDCKNDVECCNIVFDLFEDYAEEVGFKNFRNGEAITAAQAFWSEARLLWMRRSDDPNDVKVWFREVKGKPS